MSTARTALHSSKTVEWYTPPQYVEAARTVMGSIDLDPASCEVANRLIVRAKHFFDLRQGGLIRHWRGNVWLNPPYGKTGGFSNQAVWSKKLLDEYHRHNVTQAIGLFNAVPSNTWFRPLWDFPLCFTYRRIAFVNELMLPQKSPTHGNVFVYLGKHPLSFFNVFRDFGKVVLP